MASYGVTANLLSVPLLNILVVPGAVVAALLAPFGLEGLALQVMGWGLQWILSVSAWTADLPGAQRYVIGPQPMVLPLIALGMLILMLWQGRARYIGAVLALAALTTWQWAERPALLIADTGGLVGVLTDEGRALSRAKGGGFVARNWLENDGDGAAQEDAAARWRATNAPGRWTGIALLQADVMHATGKRAAAAPPECTPGRILVSNAELEATGPCQVFDAPRLRRTGAVAFVARGGSLQIVTARAITGERLWTGWPP